MLGGPGKGTRTYKKGVRGFRFGEGGFVNVVMRCCDRDVAGLATQICRRKILVFWHSKKKRTNEMLRSRCCALARSAP